MNRRFSSPDWPRLMSVDIACAYLGGMKIEAFIASDAPRLSAHKMPDGVLRFDRRDLDAWVDCRGNISPKRSDDDWVRSLGDA
jgi:hypothetical protein